MHSNPALICILNCQIIIQAHFGHFTKYKFLVDSMYSFTYCRMSMKYKWIIRQCLNSWKTWKVRSRSVCEIAHRPTLLYGEQNEPQGPPTWLCSIIQFLIPYLTSLGMGESNCTWNRQNYLKKSTMDAAAAIYTGSNVHIIIMASYTGIVMTCWQLHRCICWKVGFITSSNEYTMRMEFEVVVTRFLRPSPLPCMARLRVRFLLSDELLYWWPLCMYCMELMDKSVTSYRNVWRQRWPEHSCHVPTTVLHWLEAWQVTAPGSPTRLCNCLICRPG